jgi:hypothetical protein
MPTGVALARSTQIALLTKKRMEHSATPGAKKDSMELALSAGHTAQTVSETMVLSALSLLLMVAELGIQSGMKVSANAKTLNLAVKSGAQYGILSAVLTSTTLLAAFAHQIARMTWLILESLALSIPTAVELAIL